MLYNDRLARTAEDGTSSDGGTLHLLCECGEIECDRTLDIPSADFHELRTQHSFAVAAECQSRDREVA